MEGEGNPFEEIQSALASQIKDMLAQSDTANKEKKRYLQEIVEHVINSVPKYPLNKAIEGLAKSVLARQIRDILNQEGGSDDGKMAEVRILVESHIVNP